MSQLNQFSSRDYNYQESPFFNYQSADNKMVDAAERIEKDSRIKDRREKTARIFKMIIAVLLFTIFMQVMYHLYFSRSVKIEKIRIETSSGLSIGKEQVLDMAGLKGAESYFAVDTDVVASRLERYPQIANAVIEKKFPDTLNIKLEGRTPLAICLVEDENRVIPAVVDAEGVIFQVGKAVSDFNLPVISGVRIDGARIGAVMPEAVTRFLGNLQRLRTDSPSFFNSISELRIIRKSNDDFEVLMYPQNYSIPVRIGNKLDKELFTYIILVLDVARQQGMSGYLEELDFRTDEVVYKLREE